MRLPTTAAPDVLAALKDLDARLTALSTQDLDLKGRRVVNAGQSEGNADYVTRAELLRQAGAAVASASDGTFDTVIVRRLLQILGTVLLPHFTDGTKHHVILFVDETGALASNEDGAFALDLNLTDGHLELGYDLIVKWFNRSGLGSPSDGTITCRNHLGTGFTMFVLGPTLTAAFPGLKRDGAGIRLRVGDDSADAAFRALSVTADQFLATSPQTYAASNVTTDRTYNANATTVDELADVLGTLLQDLRALRLIA